MTPLPHTRWPRPLLPTVFAAVVLMQACAITPQDGPQNSRTGPEAAPGLAPTLPAQWQAATPAAAAAAAWPAPDAAWARFGDPVLPELVRAAQAVSPTVSAAAARIAQARAGRTAADAAGLPAIGLQAQAVQGRSTPRGGPTSSAQLGLQAGWELDLFGAVAAGRDAAQARLQAAQAGWHDAQWAVAAEVATSWVALRSCEAQTEMSQADLQSRSETARLTALSAQAGFMPPADAALARASAAQARNQLLGQQAACDTLVKVLVELSGWPEALLRQRLAPATALLAPPQALSMAEQLPAQLLSRRPDLAAAERQVVAAASDRALSAAREKPSITIRGSLAAGGGRTAGVTVTGSTWSLGPLQVDFPLFDAGLRAANTAAALAVYDDAVQQYRALVRRAVREVEAALVALQAATQREADATAAAHDFETSLRATQARQRGGLASLFDLEAARRNAVAANSALIELRRERATAWITLYRALGGGWSEGTLAAPALR